MKHNWILPVALFAMGSTFADEVIDSAYIVETTRPEKNVTVKAVPAPVAPQYDNRFGFCFDRLVYERTKNDDMYFGLDVWVGASANYKFRRHHLHDLEFVRVRHEKFSALLEAEGRVGYNFFENGRDHFTPFAGVGYLFNDIKKFHHAKFAYGTLGFQYKHELNTVFGWGLNLKGLLGQQVSNTEAKKFSWGVDFSLPVTFRFAHYRRWDVTAEPYWLYISTHHKHQNLFGGRGTLAYRF